MWGMQKQENGQSDFDENQHTYAAIEDMKN